MKKLFAAFGLSLTLAFPAFANSLEKKQPTVPAYSLAAMGCMILRECTEGVEQFTPDSAFLSGKEFDNFRTEIKSILVALNKLDVPVYIGPSRYFTPRTIGLYKPEYNRFFINESLIQDPREFLGTLRHEGWHTVQDCMGGGLKTAFMAQVHQDSEIPAWVMKMTKLSYESMGQSRAVPWEADANWAEEQANVTAQKLEMCAKGPLWEQIRPTPLTMEWLIGCGWMKPQEGYTAYTPNKRSDYCVEGKY
jgi:ribosomal protein L39E